MMNVEAALSIHRTSEPREERDRQRMVEFARRYADPFNRAIPEGHFTSSGLVMSEDGAAVLLLHHPKLQRWLQPGGHGEPGETQGEMVAAREVAEETGLEARLHAEAPRPFDVDIHAIPARKLDPEHEHLDLRYLFVADPSEPLRSEPADGTGNAVSVPPLRWFAVEEALAMDLDPGLKRMIRKAMAILGPGRPTGKYSDVDLRPSYKGNET
jgi:8-oxo-dGTP pyrophosphatase MutT (NUDIX family)